ncbi:MAG: hypothetical protein LUH12_04285 [Bacteroides sp.]|nr:hypothetical protein [Bacteroides sp.]
MIKMNDDVQKKHNLRITVEQQLIPNLFYMNGASMLDSILERQGEFFTNVCFMADSENLLAYNERDFKIEPRGFRSGDYNIYVIIADMPRSCEPDECRRIYFFYEESTGLLRYCTSEMVSDGTYALYKLLPNGSHKRIDGAFGDSADDKEKEFIAAAREFLKHFKVEE